MCVCVCVCVNAHVCVNVPVHVCMRGYARVYLCMLGRLWQTLSHAQEHKMLQQFLNVAIPAQWTAIAVSCSTTQGRGRERSSKPSWPTRALFSTTCAIEHCTCVIQHYTRYSALQFKYERRRPWELCYVNCTLYLSGELRNSVWHISLGPLWSYLTHDAWPQIYVNCTLCLSGELRNSLRLFQSSPSRGTECSWRNTVLKDACVCDYSRAHRPA